MKTLNIMQQKGTRIKNESRIDYLKQMLKTAEIVPNLNTSRADEVGMNNVVEIYFEDEDETETYKLVTSIRGNSLDNKISIESPLGKAVLGHKVGETNLSENQGMLQDIMWKSEKLKKIQMIQKTRLRAFNV